MARATLTIDAIRATAYTVPTAAPESDGTLEWNSTTIVVVEITAGPLTGLGYTYADRAAAAFITEHFSPLLHGKSAWATPALWYAMKQQVRNVGRGGLASMAIAAVDIALWDLKAKALGLPLVLLLGMVREQIPIYGSGGFTSYDVPTLQAQLGGWARAGIRMVKMKVGRDPLADLSRVEAARQAIGTETALFVDANGAYSLTEALYFAEEFTRFKVSWFEEPVVATDTDGLRLLRQRAPAGMSIAAGEYGNEDTNFTRLLRARAVDTLQIDATRSEGVTGFLQTAVLAGAHHIPVSSHTAPSIHVHLCCSVQPVIHLEYFYDHVRLEQLLFDGVVTPVRGQLAPDLTRPGLGLTLNTERAKQYLKEG